ncbi:MAG: D-alanyl-D-alanine carboxypeptidase family protein [Oscillospiraceae bacterium]
MRPFKPISPRLGGTLLALCLLLGTCTVPASAVSTSATAAVLLEAESGRVLYASAAEERMRIASTTKIMTALAALRHYDLGETVQVKREQTLIEGSSMYLREGEELTVETLLYGLLLASGNDAAEALAQHCGSRERFVGWMNDLAAEIGMTNSSFANPSGLDEEGHYSTAYDMALLAAYALQDPTFARIVSTRSITVGDRTLTNHNKLLYQVEGCIGLKTGYTKAAGRTLVSCAERGGVRLIAVTLQDGNDWADHAALYEYGFAALLQEQPEGDALAALPAGEAETETPQAKTGLAALFEKWRALF